jgi:hypothetical protein
MPLYRVDPDFEQQIESSPRSRDARQTGHALFVAARSRSELEWFVYGSAGGANYSSVAHLRRLQAVDVLA